MIKPTEMELVPETKTRPRAIRERLPNERQALTHKFRIRAQDQTYKGYITVGFYEDGDVGEVFLKMDKQGSTVSGAIDSWAISVSMLLQVGVPLKQVVDKFRGMRFEPSGFTDHPEIRSASSPVDYASRWLEHRFLGDKS